MCCIPGRFLTPSKWGGDEPMQLASHRAIDSSESVLRDHFTPLLSVPSSAK
jgi:hypothetical protein